MVKRSFLSDFVLNWLKVVITMLHTEVKQKPDNKRSKSWKFPFFANFCTSLDQ